MLLVSIHDAAAASHIPRLYHNGPKVSDRFFSHTLILIKLGFLSLISQLRAGLSIPIFHISLCD